MIAYRRKGAVPHSLTGQETGPPLRADAVPRCCARPMLPPSPWTWRGMVLVLILALKNTILGLLLSPAGPVLVAWVHSPHTHGWPPRTRRGRSPRGPRPRSEMSVRGCGADRGQSWMVRAGAWEHRTGPDLPSSAPAGVLSWGNPSRMALADHFLSATLETVFILEWSLANNLFRFDPRDCFFQ